jgi:hypothetical protein
MEDQFEDILKRLDKNVLAGWLRTYAEKDEKFGTISLQGSVRIRIILTLKDMPVSLKRR